MLVNNILFFKFMKFGLIICLFFCGAKLHAQSNTSEKHYKHGGIEVEKGMSFDYVRHYSLTNLDTIAGEIFVIKEYYQNGIIKMIGSSYFKGNLEYFDGQFNYYDSEGQLIETTVFKKGYKLGNSYHFYANRKLKKELFYEYHPQHDTSLRILENQGLNHESIFARGRVIEYRDSIGNKIVSAGNGSVKLAVNYLGDDFIEEGSYVNGLKEGEWTLIAQQGGKTYVESYRKGKLIVGTYLNAGKRKKYKYLLSRPKVENINFIASYREEVISPTTDYQKTYLTDINNSFLEGNSSIDIIVECNLVIDKTGRLLDVEFFELMPKAISERIIEEVKRKGTFSAGRYRGEAKQMKLPHRLTFRYYKI